MPKPTVLAGKNTVIGFLPTGRPVVYTSRGEFATHKNIIVNLDGKETIIPTMYDGQELTEEQAITLATKNNLRDPYTRKPFPQFDTVEEALSAEEELHKQLEIETDKVIVGWKKQKGLWGPGPD